ncbi:hypothetical protein JNW88_18865 [Micromonospora sp. ATA32]|nr:hypothetical protein [Micromonospora sp. ATA32]
MPGDGGLHIELPLFELPADSVALVDDTMMGCLIIERDTDGTVRGGRLGYRPGMLVGDLRTLGEWATSRVDRFLQHGAEPDGWRRRSDGGWQLWAQFVELPPLD